MRLVRHGDAATGAQAAALFALANGLVGVEGVIDERADRPCAYRTKHLPASSRTNAVGIVDNDAEGIGAESRFVSDGGNWNHVSLLKLATPAHLMPAQQLGLSIPVTLEELWPLSIWEHAEREGWLANRQKTGILSEALVNRLAVEDIKLSDLIDDEWRIYYDFCADGGWGSQAKSAWASYASGRPRPQLERLAAAPLAELDRALAALGIAQAAFGDGEVRNAKVDHCSQGAADENHCVRVRAD